MRPFVPASLLALLVFAAVPGGADHPQDAGWEEEWIAFDHVAGNEWWVEVAVDSSWDWDVVSARDDGGDWVPLEKRSWGVWAGSFHIEPGHRVQFQAIHTPAGGPDEVQSCWFTHPDGVEQCESGPAAPVAFDHTGGNEWWVQVDVQGSASRVESQDTDGTWVGLEKKSWGDWAGSYHIEPGNEVRFRALVDGGWMESCWFTHPGGKTPDGGEACGAGSSGGDPEPEPEPGPELVFDHRGGNEWWVEVHVDGSYNVHFVHAEDSSGETKRLELKDWGNWAGSFHIAPGDRVRFYANDRDGTPAMVSCWFTHPGGATPDGGQTCEGTAVGSEPEPEPEPTVDVAFAPKAGNAWWVETFVVANETVTSVEARSDGGAWHRLTLRDWGAWAGSFHAPAGSTVEFRATTADGTDVSDGFVWPQARPVGSTGQWPEEGSYARYETSAGDPEPSSTEGTWTIVYHDGAWWSLHEAVRTSEWGSQEERRFCVGHQYPHGPESPHVGATVDVEVEACTDHSYQVVVEGMTSETARQDGRSVSFDVWEGSRIEESCHCIEWTARWDPETGLVTHAGLAGFRSGSQYTILDTDAPVAG